MQAAHRDDAHDLTLSPGLGHRGLFVARSVEGLPFGAVSVAAGKRQGTVEKGSPGRAARKVLCPPSRGRRCVHGRLVRGAASAASFSGLGFSPPTPLHGGSVSIIVLCGSPFLCSRAHDVA